MTQVSPLEKFQIEHIYKNVDGEMDRITLSEICT